MSTNSQILASYVPNLITDRLIVAPDESVAPVQDILDGVVLFADISGFTPLTESLVAQGTSGTEKLSTILSDYFGPLIDLINEYGGDTVKFAGDALLSIWRLTPNTNLNELVQLAGRCALLAQQAAAQFETPSGRTLQMSISIGVGRLRVLQVGGLYGRWELIFSGNGLIEVSRAETIAQPGEVILSKRAGKYLYGIADMQPRPGDHQRLVSLNTVLQPRPLTRPQIPVQATAALKALMPGAILARLNAGQSDWLAELRRVSVLFINITELTHDSSLTQAQKIMLTLQRVLYRYEGSLNKISIDDKGVTFLAALGLPPLAHVDDAVRATRAALELHEAVQEIGLHATIGITTGRVFCGSIGNTTRREYTLIGAIVNLASRLMQAAGNHPHRTPPILCDEQTYTAASENVNFQTLVPIRVKGKQDAVPVFRPVGIVESSISASEPIQDDHAIIGRLAEIDQLANTLLELSAGHDSVTIISGEAGIGKSRLVEEVIARAAHMGIGVFWGSGDAVEQTSPYLAWREIFSQLFDLRILNVRSDTNANTRHVIDLLEDELELLRRTPLLNGILPIDVPENELTSQMNGQVRADNTRELLLQLLQESAARSPKLIVIEDAHWLDSASWALLNLVIQFVSPIAVMIVIRPQDSVRGESPIYAQIKAEHATQHIRLTELDEQYTTQLIKQKLNTNVLPSEISRFVQEKAAGHPFFTQELTYALREEGTIAVINGACQLRGSLGELADVQFPDTIQGVIISRLDRLSPQEQLVLKVASVIGRLFEYELLNDVYPVPADQPRLQEYIETLIKLNIIDLDTNSTEPAYIFKNELTREVTYSLMAYSQRRELHHAVATWHEDNFTSELTAFYPLLAHHWLQAEKTDKAIKYFELAGQEALRNGVYEEARRFFYQLLDMTAIEQQVTDRDPIQQASWRRQLAEASFGSGDTLAAQSHLEEARGWLGARIPSGRTQWLWHIARQTTIQFLQQLPIVKRRQTASNQKRLEMVKSGLLLSKIYSFSNEPLGLFGTALQSFNIAARINEPETTARTYAQMTPLVGYVGMHGLAKSYDRLAHQAAEQTTSEHVKSLIMQQTGVYHLSLGRWDRVIKNIESVWETTRTLGDRRLRAESLVLLGHAYFLKGDNTTAKERFQKAASAAAGGSSIQQQIWSQTGIAQCLLRDGNFDSAIEILRAVRDQLAHIVDYNEEIRAGGMLAAAYFEIGHLESARKVAVSTSDFIVNTKPTSPILLAGYAATTSVFLSLWEMDTGRPKMIKRHTKQLIEQLAILGRRFPIAKPEYAIAQGRRAVLTGGNKTNTHWPAALNEAERLKMPFEKARVHFENGRTASEKDERNRLLKMAAAEFTELGLTYHTNRALTLLEK